MIDFHCHIDLFDDPRAVADRLRRDRIYTLSVTTTPKAFLGTQRIAEGCPRIRTALGLHPQLAHQRRSELDLFRLLLPQARYVGEIGLDASPEFKNYLDDQLFVFQAILKLCSEAGGRVMSIHSRGAASIVLENLRMFPSSGLPVLHWFSGTHTELRQAISIGAWFSVGPAMLKSKKGVELIRRMPADRVLTETDAPFAATRGRNVDHSDLDDAVSQLAQIWGYRPLEAEKKLLSNLRSISSYADTCMAK